jgi:hypothetical protein
MKKLLLILLCLPFIGFAQSVPQGINYQAVARDATGAELANDTLTVQFSILSNSITGNASWQETHTVITNNFGLFTAVIGGGAANPGASATFDAINWGASTHFLKVELNGIDMGTTQLMSVPYSLYTKTADNIDPTDELQTLSISGDTISISNGNSIVIQ